MDTSGVHRRTTYNVAFVNPDVYKYVTCDAHTTIMSYLLPAIAGGAPHLLHFVALCLFSSGNASAYT